MYVASKHVSGLFCSNENEFDMHYIVYTLRSKKIISNKTPYGTGIRCFKCISITSALIGSKCNFFLRVFAVNLVQFSFNFIFSSSIKILLNREQEIQ